MKKIFYLWLVAVFLLINGCMMGKQTDAPPVPGDVNIDQKPKNCAGLTIAKDGVQWDPGSENSKSFEEILLEVPFKVQLPSPPFGVTHRAAEIVPAPFDIIRLTFANVDIGEQLILSISNSKDNSKPEGEKGPKLSNGSQTWIQSNRDFSGLYWRYEGLTYALASTKVEQGAFVPLYDISDLVEIANTIKNSSQ